MILTPAQFQARRDRNETFRILDLRAPEVAAAAPLAGLDAVAADRLHPIPPSDLPTLLVCEVGIVTEGIIEDQELENTFSLLGGAQAWEAFVQEESDLGRWSRQLALPELGLDGQRRLRQASVAVVGLGGLGCPAALSLAAAGIGRLVLVDGDRIELSNLHRQTLYGEGDVGRSKVETAVARLAAMHPGTVITSHHVFFDGDTARDILKGVDVIVDATDNPAGRLAVDDAARELGIPSVYGALHRFEGQVAVLNHRGGPSYRDLFPEQDARPAACADAGVLAMLPAIVGNIQALEAVKLIAGIDTNLSGRLLLYDGLAHTTTLIDP